MDKENYVLKIATQCSKNSPSMYMITHGGKKNLEVSEMKAHQIK